MCALCNCSVFLMQIKTIQINEQILYGDIAAYLHTQNYSNVQIANQAQLDKSSKFNNIIDSNSCVIVKERHQWEKTYIFDFCFVIIRSFLYS